MALDTQRVGHSIRHHPGWFAAARSNISDPGRRSTPGPRGHRSVPGLLLRDRPTVDYMDGGTHLISLVITIWQCGVVGRPSARGPAGTRRPPRFGRGAPRQLWSRRAITLPIAQLLLSPSRTPPR